MKTLYIFNPAKYRGTIENTMSVPDDCEDDFQDLPVDYSGETFAEYNQNHGGALVALPWDVFEKEFYNPHLKSLQEPFEEITEEHFDDMLGCLPPRRWTNINNGFYFFMSECYSADLYLCCVKKDGKHYSALRSIRAKHDDIVNLSNV